MTVNVASLAATQQENEGQLGHLFWYSVVEGNYPADELRTTLESRGQDEYMPRKIAEADAFRNATSKLKQNRLPDPMAASGDDVYLNVLIRDVSNDDKSIVRHMVIERVDRSGKKLSYDPEVAVMLLEKNTGKVETEAHSELAEQKVNEMLEQYELCLGHYNARAVREIVSRILGDLSPTPVRPSGGVYFVPKQYKERLENLQAFINEMGESEAFKIPLIDSSENVDMVRQKMSDYMSQLAAESSALCKKHDVPASLLRRKMLEIKKLVNQKTEYERSLQVDMSFIDTAESILKRQGKEMLMRISEIEAEKAAMRGA